MPPRVDVTQDRECSVCGELKGPDNYAKCNPRKDSAGIVTGHSLRSECKDCNKAKAAAKTAAIRSSIATATGTKASAPDFLNGQWTMTQGKQSAPEPVRMKYVKFSDISPAFADLHGPLAFIPAKVTSDDGKIAHRTLAGKVAFVPIVQCLLKLGLKQCTRCPDADNVHPLADFALANTVTGQLRGECHRCTPGRAQY